MNQKNVQLSFNCPTCKEPITVTLTKKELEKLLKGVKVGKLPLECEIVGRLSAL